MKKKITAVCLAVVIAVLAIAGGTLAYLTDKDNVDNVFTFGNVDIELEETFVQNSKLFPGLDINKDIWVENTGSEEAFVRVHIAIPSMLDSGSEDEPEYAAYNNTLHFNFEKASIADGQWNWSTTINGANYPGNGGAWNCYTQEIDGILYNVYVVTYETAVASGAATATNALDKVYLDTSVTNEDIAGITGVLGETPLIKVVAEACQTPTFDDAYDALNTAFGVPGSYNPWG